MTVLVVSDGTQSRTIDRAELPLAIGVAAGTLTTGPDAEAFPAMWIVSHPNGFSIQPEAGRTPVIHNGTRLGAAAWLRNGDSLTIGDVAVAVSVDGDTTTLRAIPPAAPNAPRQARRFGVGAGLEGDGRGFSALLTAKKIALAVFLVLVLGVGYVIVASPLTVRVTPEPDTVLVSSWPPALPIGDRYLLLPGRHVVDVYKKGYRPLRTDVSVSYGSAPLLELTLQKLPGQLAITTAPIEGARILVDGAELSKSPATLELEAGTREIQIVSERYLPETRRVEIEGMGKRQDLHVELRPAWGTLAITSVPEQAAVRLDGKEIGKTPLTADVLQGSHQLDVHKDGWKAVTRRIEVQAGATTTLPTITLERLDGTIDLTSDPPGASVLVDGQFRGQTPLSLNLVGENDYRLTFTKAGYETNVRTVRVGAAASTRLAVRLKPELGTVFLTTSPPGATLTINGRPSGSATRRLTLQTVPQTLEITKEGYQPSKTTITPERGVPKRLDVVLKTVGDAIKERVSAGLFTRGGQKLTLVYLASPARFTVGSSRRDPSRRSNEVEYQVELTRSFLISEKEVTNGEYRKFKPTHNSGSYQSNSLDGADQPVVNVSWEDAARYANWLSEQEGLEPAYREQGGKLVPVIPLTNGYRLPTEAEWEFVARYDGGRRPLTQPRQFEWGDSMPPAKNSGNFAHDGSGLPFSIPRYVDSFTVTAPVGKFPPNALAIYDLGGNVAEWCHDFYDVALGASTGTRRDPTGPAAGRFHVIKGASWRSGSATELRFAYRDYADKPRDDVGFRVVRYVDP